MTKKKECQITIFTSRGAYINLVMLYTHSIGNQPYNTMVVFKIHDSVPSARYSSVCNVLSQSRSSPLRSGLNQYLSFRGAAAAAGSESAPRAKCDLLINFSLLLAVIAKAKLISI